MAKVRLELVNRLRELIGGWDAAPVHASLFGSAARGDGDAKSDIDIFLVRPKATDEDDEEWRACVEDLAESVERWTGNVASIIELPEKKLGALRKRRPPALSGLTRDAIDLAGLPVRRSCPGPPDGSPREEPRIAGHPRRGGGWSTRACTSTSPTWRAGERSGPRVRTVAGSVAILAADRRGRRRLLRGPGASLALGQPSGRGTPPGPDRARWQRGRAGDPAADRIKGLRSLRLLEPRLRRAETGDAPSGGPDRVRGAGPTAFDLNSPSGLRGQRPGRVSSAKIAWWSELGRGSTSYSTTPKRSSARMWSIVIGGGKRLPSAGKVASRPLPAVSPASR